MIGKPALLGSDQWLVASKGSPRSCFLATNR